MRIVLPERISLQWATVGAVSFMVLQLVQGTSFSFSILHMVFLVLWVVTFNLSGGFTRASGAYVFWFGLLTIPVGTATKAAIGEAADSLAWVPTATMAVYTVSMGVLLLSVMITRYLTGGVTSIAGRLRSYNLDYRNASIGCCVVGLGLPWAMNLVDSGTGTIFSVIRQVNYFTEVGVILGTIAVVEGSKGRRAWGFLNGVPAFLAFLQGFATFTKAGMFTPLLCWMIGAAYSRYRISVRQVVVIAALSFTLVYAMVPISQTGRNYRTMDTSWVDSFFIAVNLLENLGQTRAIYNEAAADALSASSSYYGKDVSIFARLSRFESDDTLISYTLHGHYYGYASLWYAYLNWFPHIILPNKEAYAPVEMGGNYYAREIGMLSPQDRTTGISFGPPAEAFHFGGWTGLVLVELLVWTMLLTSVDLLCGDLRRSPWGLFFAMVFSHVAPEGAILSTVYFIWVGNFGLFCVMIFSTYGAPVIGALLTGAVSRRATPPASVELGRVPAAAAPSQS